MTLNIDKMNGHGLSNIAHLARQVKKIKLILYYPWKEVYKLPSSSSKIEHFNYKVSRQALSNTFKRRLGFSYTVIYAA